MSASVSLLDAKSSFRMRSGMYTHDSTADEQQYLPLDRLSADSSKSALTDTYSDIMWLRAVVI